MGIFRTSKEEEFNNTLVDFWNLLVKLSRNDISWDFAANKYNSLKNNLLYIAQEFDDPFSAYFKRYTHNTGVFGEKTSIGEGIVIAQFAIDYYARGGRFTQETDFLISSKAKLVCSSEERRNAIREFIRNYDS